MHMTTAPVIHGYHPVNAATAAHAPPVWAGVVALALAPEQRLFAAGSTGGSGHEITAGIVRLERVTAAGQRRIIRLAGPGDLIGQEALLRQPYRNDAVACTPVRLRRVALPPAGQTPQGHLPSALVQRWQHTLDASEFWSARPEIFVAIGICTHLGCSPTEVPSGSNNPSVGDHWPGGFFCPCHGSTFDLAGRVFKNKPAPTNLEIPPHRYVSDTQLLIGESTAA